MPKSAVSRAFSTRGWGPASATPANVYGVAGWLGVGYDTLVHHMHRSLALITAGRARELRRASPKSIKCGILGKELAANLLIVDKHWTGRPVDLEVGDEVLGPPDVIWEGNNIAPTDEVRLGRLFTAAAPGTGRLVAKSGAWSAFVRVSRDKYIGRSVFRHLEEVEDD